MVIFITNIVTLLVMKASDPSKPKDPHQPRRVILNIPAGLLEEFDKICSLKHYQRLEGVKQAMREFIDDQFPDDYVSPEESKEQYTAMWMGMMDAMVKIKNDPKYKKLEQENLIQAKGGEIKPTQLPTSTKQSK